jgi:MFS family permease
MDLSTHDNLYGCNPTQPQTFERKGNSPFGICDKSSKEVKESNDGTTSLRTDSTTSSEEIIHNRRIGDMEEENAGNTDESHDVQFIHFFLASRGPPQIVFLCMLWSLAFGSTVGVVPSVLTDQYAKIYHGFPVDDSCANYDKDSKPSSCLDGSSDAQSAAAIASFVSNTFTFLTSSLVGSISDQYGRRNVLVLGELLAVLGPFCLVILQIFPSTNPNWYYISSSFGGIISWVSIALSALSDVMPKKWRAPMFGLLLSGFSLGFALSPVLALGFSHLGVSLLSLFLLMGAFLYSVFFLPETLPPAIAEEARNQRRIYLHEGQVDRSETWIRFFTRAMIRPFQELSILNRNGFFRLLSALAFFSGMSSSADQTLLLYYVEDRLNFNDHDVAIMFGLIGLLGIFVLGVLLRPLTSLLGEKLVVVVSFIMGAMTNTLYAFAPSKSFIFLAVCISSFGGMSFPTISAIKSNNVEEFEQGRIQGALYALSSLSSAVGPCLLRLAYQVTKDTSHPGSFFLVATVFFVIATFCAWSLPTEKANSVKRRDSSSVESGSDLVQDSVSLSPLLD